MSSAGVPGRLARACAAASVTLLVACGGNLPRSGAGAIAPSVAEGGEAGDEGGRAAVRLRDEAAERLRAAGAEPLLDGGWAGVAVEGQVLALELPVRPGRCTGLFVRASGGVQDVDARLFAPDGTALAVDEEPDPEPLVLGCPRRRAFERFYGRIHVFKGAGTVVAVPFVLDPARSDAFARSMGHRVGVASGPDVERFDALREALRQRGYRVAEGVSRAVRASEGLPVRVPFYERAGQCYAIVAVPPRSGGSVQGRLLDPWDRVVVASEPGQPDARLQWCAPADRRSALELKLRGGEGEVVVHAFEVESAEVGADRGSWEGLRRGEVASGLSEAQLRERLARILARARRAGGDGSRSVVTAPEVRRLDAWTAWPVEASSGVVGSGRGPRCLAWLALGGGGVHRLRWVAGAASAATLARGAWPGEPAVAWLLRCDGRDAERNHVTLVAEGTGGPVLLARFEVPAASDGSGPAALARLLTRLEGWTRPQERSGRALEVAAAGCVRALAWTESGGGVQLSARRQDDSVAAAASGWMAVAEGCARQDGPPLHWHAVPRGEGDASPVHLLLSAD